MGRFLALASAVAAAACGAAAATKLHNNEKSVFDAAQKSGRLVLIVYVRGDMRRYESSQKSRDHMIKSRGYRIELGEIESAALAHPAVQEACAVAIPDAQLGHRIRACIVLRATRETRRSVGPDAQPGAAVLDRAGLENHLARQLPRYMLPQEVVFLKTLPKTSTGKVDRCTLAADLSSFEQQKTP